MEYRRFSPGYYAAIRDIHAHLDSIMEIIIRAKEAEGEGALTSREKDSLKSAAVLLQVPYTNFHTEIREQRRLDGELPPFEEELKQLFRPEEA